jgi:phospholipid/cholesterol/gamma-HCH transport system permease protein
MPDAIQTLLLECESIFRFVQKLIKQAVARPFEWRETVRQCFEIGNRSLFLVCFTAFLSGVVFTRQSRPSLSSFGAESWLPSLVSQAVIRSLGPLITGLICAGKLGSNIAAELASMKVTEQIDAMEIMGINSASYLILPKIVAALFIFPFMVILSMFIGISAGAFVGYTTSVTSLNDFEYGLQYDFEMWQVSYSVIKTFFFAFIITSVSSYHGYFTHGGPREVGASSTRAVVYSMVLILM